MRFKPLQRNGTASSVSSNDCES